MSEELKALQTVADELAKIHGKYIGKATKEREKVLNVYVTICGEKCYTEQEINEWIEGDYITAAQADKYIEKLEAKQKKAGEFDGRTGSERVCDILRNLRNNISLEIQDIKNREEQKRKREERWEIAQAQGCSYAEWLNQEELSQKSIEYEENEERKRKYGIY